MTDEPIELPPNVISLGFHRRLRADPALALKFERMLERLSLPRAVGFTTAGDYE